VTTKALCIQEAEVKPEMVFNWVDDAGKPKAHTWCPTVKKHIKAREEKMPWQTRSRKTHAKGFLARHNAARPTARCSALLHMGLGSTGLDAQPHARAISCQIESQEMGTLATAQCDCGHGDESFLHQQLHCHLTHRRNLKQTAHNNVAKVVENQVKQINLETRHAQWDQKVLTFLTHSATANNLKVSNHSTRSTKRKLDELLEPFNDTALSQQPDGLIEDTKLKHIYTIKVTRTDDSSD